MSNVLGIGTHIAECLRIHKMLERHGELFTERVYTSDEIHFCRSRRQPLQHFTACWAAKEAILKALGLAGRKRLPWRDVEIRYEPGGGCNVAVRGAIRETVEQLRAGNVLVTTSFCRTHATAYALVVGREEE
jgi:holo-[acyl-carrier protein] synthase